MTSIPLSRPGRRTVLAALLATAALPRALAARTPPDPEPAPFSFEGLTEEMRRRAAEPHRPAPDTDTFLDRLTYEDYRNIAFDPDRARWLPEALQFHVHAFHPGWLFEEAVAIHEVVDGLARPMTFSIDDFIYRNGVGRDLPEHAALSGVAGFRLHHPINRADVWDELLSFLGASYFRALGRGNSYGLSARGLAIDTWREGPEEFPRFSEFWLERPAPGAQEMIVHAALESPSVTGAYRFVIRPGTDTVMEVTARLNFRRAVTELGVAPLTSMFWFSEHSERRFDDYRPQVHDSDALQVVRRGGDRLWRPLNNPARLAGSYMEEPDLQSFGLMQRDRRYADYEDAGARYHDRPSVVVEPLGDWGAGSVRLVEIPAELEVEDNIAAFWVPETGPAAGEAREYRYRLHWGALRPEPGRPLAWVRGTLAGIGGASGVEVTNPNLRKFVVDFEGGLIAAMPETAAEAPEDGEPADLVPVVTHSAGRIEDAVLFKVPGTSIWRLVLDVDGGEAPLVELGAHLAGSGRKLSEIWLHQWVREV